MTHNTKLKANPMQAKVNTTDLAAVILHKSSKPSVPLANTSNVCRPPKPCQTKTIECAKENNET